MEALQAELSSLFRRIDAEVASCAAKAGERETAVAAREADAAHTEAARGAAAAQAAADDERRRAAEAERRAAEEAERRAKGEEEDACRAQRAAAVSAELGARQEAIEEQEEQLQAALAAVQAEEETVATMRERFSEEKTRCEAEMEGTARRLDADRALLDARVAEFEKKVKEWSRMHAGGPQPQAGLQQQLFVERTSFLPPRRRKMGVEEAELLLVEGRTRADHPGKDVSHPFRATADFTLNLHEGTNVLPLRFYAGAHTHLTKACRPAVVLHCLRDAAARVFLPAGDSDGQPQVLVVVVDLQARVLTLSHDDILVARDGMWSASSKEELPSTFTLSLTLHAPGSYVEICEQHPR